MSESKRLNTLLGFDYGTQKIGVAVGQTITATASPLTEVRARNGVPDWDAVSSLISEWRPDALIVGLPLNMDGSDSELSARAEKFSRQLHGRYSLPCFTVDERLSSREAREISREQAERSGRKYDSHEKIDGVAACLILESWLRENC